MDGKMIITVIAAWVSYMAINKWIWTPMRRRPNPIRKEDDDDPPSLPSSSAGLSSAPSPPPPIRKKDDDDPPSLPSSSAGVSSAPPPPPPIRKEDDDPPSLPSSSAGVSSAPPPPPSIRKEDDDPPSLPSSSAGVSSAPPPSPPIRKEDDDPPSLPSSSAGVSSAPPPPPPIRKEYDDPPSHPSLSVVSSSPPLPPEPKDDPALLPSSSDEVSSSSSHPSPPRLQYDVFLSFRGLDTRKGIANLLYKELESSGIKTFMDEEGLKVGAEISSNLLKAIKESRSAIVLLSPNYATSRWCLNELASIIQGFETRNTTVIPIFYNVEARDVRHQMGSFEEAFIRYEQRKEEKVEHWKAALTKVANLSGLELKNYRSDKQLVEDIVQCVYSTVRDLEIESPEDFVEYEATRKAMGKIMNALKDDRFTAIGICGSGGTGKTTLARHVAAEVKKKGIFDHVVMAVVTHEPVLKDIQGQLAVQLGVKLDEKETIHERASKLSQVIMRKNKILIILDDIWKKTDLSLIGIPSYKMLEDRSSKVLLTTRNSEVCSSMDSHPNIALDILNHEDSWNLFVKKTRMSSEKLAVVNEEASILVKECAGLPIALVAIARALRDEDITEWKEAAERLKSSQRRNSDDVVLNCIKLSYDQLTSEDAKLCFLLCCLFPEDYDIQIEELMMYAFGKGLFREGNTLQEARIDCRSAVRSLKSSSLLLGSKHDGHVRMHDVIRDVAGSISSSEDGQSVFDGAGRFQTWPKIDRGYCAISLMMNKIRKLPKNLVCSELKILLLQHNPDVSTIPESFLGCLRELSVLNLSKTSISVLPPSFSLLTNLHSLLLDSCMKISDISVLGKLEKLEILSLRECCPEEVPEAIGNLSRLRMLDISESPVVKIASQVISRLSGLEELYMQCDFVDWRNEVEEAGKETNIGFDELTGSSYLRILKVGIPNAMVLPKNVEDPPDWLYFDICISSDSEVRESTWKPHSSHDYSRALTLSTPIHNLPEWFTDVVTEKAEKLHYRKCKGLYNILVEYDCGRLNELRYLSIIGPHENLEELMNAGARDSNKLVTSDNAAFPKLEELHLFEVENINNLCVGTLPPGSLCKLKLLDVRKCHNLVNALLQSPLLERLQFLEKLLCAHLNCLEYVFGPGKTTTCEKLKEMRLCRLPELIKIWSGQAPHAIFLNLKTLAVSGCKKLKSLFTSDIAHCLLQLEDLWVHSCFSLDRIVELSEETGKRNVIFPKLQNLVLEDLPRLRRLYGNSSGGPTSLEIEFPSLEYFYKLECPRFSPSAPNFHSKKQVQVNNIQHYSSLKERLWENMEPEFTISEDGRRRWKYDVFLSFRGIDTGKSITSELYDRLQRSGVSTFIDDSRIGGGDVISPTILEIIEESRFAVVVLSPNYASSTWCLEELAKIYECMTDQNIFPIFYHVDASDGRHQRKSFEDAFTQHENSRRHGDKVDTWRDVLKQVCYFSGWHCKTDIELVDAIVDSVLSKVEPGEIEFTVSGGDFQAFGATRQAMDKVMETLKDDKVTVIGVHGMGGVGKTTMVQHAAAKSKKNGTFRHVIMVFVSQIPDLRRIQATIAEMLGFRLEVQTEMERADRLFKEIMGREKILIILDDIWERIELESIGIPSFKDLQRCGSKLLITTRRLNVCHVMGCQVSIVLDILSEEDSWTLFVRNAGTIPFEPAKFERVARKVARECRGLPVALMSVARGLRDTDLVGWELAARRLEKSQSASLDDHGEAFKSIKLSYDYLRNEDYKSFFLLCCLFPEDFDIPLEDLFKYAIGKGLFQYAETIEEAREAAYTMVRYLKNSSLLLDSKEDGCVRMHDVVRETALSIAQSEVGFFVKAGSGLKGWPRGRLPEGCTVISLMKNEICKLPEEELVCPNLQILLLQDNADLNEIPEIFFQSLNELRLLDVSNTSISSLPQSISLLTNLQALYLDFCKRLIDISIVGRLEKLEILSMRECHLEEFPREIEKLTNLRILDVSCTEFLIIPSKVISKLYRLEELYILNCGFENLGTKVEREGEETELDFAGLPSLKIVQVCISDAKYIPRNVEVKPDWDYFYILIGGSTRYSYKRYDHKSRSLVLQTTMSTLPDWFINVVTKRTEKIEYDCCKGMSDIVKEYDHGRLHNLKHLTVRGSLLDSFVYLKELMNTTRRVQTGPVYENLEELHLINLIEVKELCVGELPPGSLFNLKVFHVFLANMLKNVSKFVQSLPNLEKLDLNCLHRLEYVFGCQGWEQEQSKLTEMHLMDLDALRSICSGPAPHAMFQSLKFLTIYRCKLLQSLFASDVAQCLFQLEDLLVEDCPLLKKVMEAEEKTVLPKLKNLVLKNLPILYGASATTVDIECPSLEQLMVVDCPMLPFSTSSVHLRSLESRNKILFSTASDYFGSTYPVQLNDLQLYQNLQDRTSGFQA